MKGGRKDRWKPVATHCEDTDLISEWVFMVALQWLQQQKERRKSDESKLGTCWKTQCCCWAWYACGSLFLLFFPDLASLQCIAMAEGPQPLLPVESKLSFSSINSLGSFSDQSKASVLSSGAGTCPFRNRGYGGLVARDNRVTVFDIVLLELSGLLSALLGGTLYRNHEDSVMKIVWTVINWASCSPDSDLVITAKLFWLFWFD